MFCTNCGMKFEGKFCPVCGQKATEVTEGYKAAERRIHQQIIEKPPIVQRNTASNSNAVYSPKFVPTQKNKGNGTFICVVLIVLVASFSVFRVAFADPFPEDDSDLYEVDSYYSSLSPGGPDPDLTPISFPSHGKVNALTGGVREAPFKITVPGDYCYYYIMLQDTVTGQTAITAYIYGGNTIEFDVPYGTYELFYCCGDYWYGEKNKFGINGCYYTTDEIFKFYSDDSYAYGNTVSLFSTYNGNMDEVPVSYSAFPK